MTKDIPVFPVAAWTIGTVPTMDVALIRFDFLSNPLQSPEEASPGRHYALTSAQLRDLIVKLQVALHTLETGESSKPQDPKH